MNIRCIRIPAEAGKVPYIDEIENGLEAMQAAVGGYIEPFNLTDDIYLLCNEEGRLLGLPANPWAPAFRGDLVIVGSLYEDFAGLEVGIACAMLNDVMDGWLQRGTP